MDTKTILANGRYVKTTKHGNKIYAHNGQYWAVFSPKDPTGYAWGSEKHFTDATI